MTFLEFLRSCSLMPPEIITPGRWQRCPTESNPRKKNGSFKLCEDEKAGFAMDYALHTECQIWRAGEDFQKLGEIIEMEAINARLDARRLEQHAAMMRARSYYDRAKPLNFAQHAYLERKRLDMTGAYGLRVHDDGALVVPMIRGRGISSVIASVQRIEPDGTKLFAQGASVKGAVFEIKRKGSTVTILCEGLATGLTLFAACPDASVIVAFSAANMIEVAKERTWSGLCVVAADNDHETAKRIGRNPGLESASAAAHAIRCGVAIPECKGTDFNDLFCEMMAMGETIEAESKFPQTPAALRALMLSPIKQSIMREARYIAPKP